MQEQTEKALDHQDFQYVSFSKDQVNIDIAQQYGNQSANQSLMMTSLLSQALKSLDKQLIEYALENTASSLINESVLSLELESLQQLSNFIVDTILSYPYRTASLLPWCKAVIFRGHGDFSKLYYTFEQRTQNYEAIKKLDDKLDYLKSIKVQERLKKQINKRIFIEDLSQNKVIETQEPEQYEQLLDEFYNENNQMDQEEDIDRDYDQVYKMNQQNLRQDAEDEELIDEPEENFIKF